MNEKMVNLSLRTKIVLSLTGLILLFGFGAAFYGSAAFSRILDSELREKGASLAEGLAVQSEPLLLIDDTFSIHELFNSSLKSDADLRYIFIVSPSGAIRYQTLEKGMPVGLRQANAVDSGLEQSLSVLDTNEGKVLDVASPIRGGKDGTLRLGLSYARQGLVIKYYVYVILLLVGIATVLAFIISHYLARFLTRPIAALSKVTRSVAQGDLSLKAHQGRDEIGRLGTDFNIMTEKLSASRDELLTKNRELTVLNEIRSHLLKQVIKAQEEERKRIARELHDDVGQVLSRIAVVSENIENRGYEHTNPLEKISGIKKDANYALQSLRETILDLRPAVLDDLGLLPAIRWYARERLEKSGVRFHLEAKGIKDRLNPQIEVILFRVMQEAINNIAKYARAKEASIAMELNNGQLIVEIQDNGSGFNVEKVLNSATLTNLGILGMRERLTLIDGVLKIHSEEGKGTTIHLEIPYTSPDPSSR